MADECSPDESSRAAPVRDNVPTTASDYYPETISPLRAQLPVVNREFAELREAYLLSFGERTAMAYWGDLEQFHDWCLEQSVDVLRPQSSDVQAFLDEHCQLGYSLHTIARRLTTLRGFYTTLVESNELSTNPINSVTPVQRPTPTAEVRRRRRAAGARISARRIRNRDYQHLLKRLQEQHTAYAMMVPILLEADGLSKSQIARISCEDIAWQASGRLRLRIQDRGVQTTITLRLQSLMAEWLHELLA